MNNFLFTYLIPNNKNENGYNDGKVTYHINRVDFNLNVNPWYDILSIICNKIFDVWNF